jgi:hypothetical protein
MNQDKVLMESWLVSCLHQSKKSWIIYWIWL